MDNFTETTSTGWFSRIGKSITGLFFGFILIGGIYAFGINRRRKADQRDLQVQAWHLRQLLPKGRNWQTRR